MSKTQPGPFVAVIGDMVHSRALPAARRARAQRELADLVATINRRLRSDIASRFLITIGDEFQGLLTNAAVLPDLIWLLETQYHVRPIRVGVGLGVLHTPLHKKALNIMDGPALHEARAAINEARAKRLLGGVFKGFGPYDDVLLGFAQALRYMRARLTARQAEVMQMLRDGQTQATVSTRLKISKQGVSEHAIAAGWEAYRLAEFGWRKALVMATPPKTTRGR